MLDSQLTKALIAARRIPNARFVYGSGETYNYCKDQDDDTIATIAFGECNIYYPCELQLMLPICLQFLVEWGDPNYLQMHKWYCGDVYEKIATLKVANSYKYPQYDRFLRVDIKLPLKTNIIHDMFIYAKDYSSSEKERLFDLQYKEN